MKIGICEDGQVVQGVAVEKTRVLSQVSTRVNGSGARGVSDALRKLLKATVQREALEFVAVATALPEALLEQQRNLRKVAVVRVSAPSGFYEPPLLEATAQLRRHVLKTMLVARGGHEIDGREIAPLDETELKWLGQNLKGKVDAVVVSSPFSPVYPDQEERATKILAGQLGPQTLIFPAHQAGDMGMPYRENAAVLNAALTKGVQQLVKGIQEMLGRFGGRAPLYLLQNHGLLMSADQAMAYPISILYSSFTAKLLGLSLAAPEAHGVLVDHRQDSLWIGAVKQGLPLVSDWVDVNGLRLNSGGPTLVTLPLQGRLLAKALGAFMAQAQTEVVFANTAEGSRRVKDAVGRKGVSLPHPEVLGALGVAQASLGVRLVKVFTSTVMLKQAFKAAAQVAKQRCLEMGAVRESVTVRATYEAPVATLPAGAHRVVAVVTARPSPRGALPSRMVK